MIPHEIKTLEKFKVSLLGQTSSQCLAKGRTFVRCESVEKDIVREAIGLYMEFRSSNDIGNYNCPLLKLKIGFHNMREKISESITYVSHRLLR